MLRGWFKDADVRIIMPDCRYGCGEESEAPGCHLQKLMTGRQLSTQFVNEARLTMYSRLPFTLTSRPCICAFLNAE